MSVTSAARAAQSPVNKRALLAELLRKKIGEEGSEFPLSYGQKALLYLSHVQPGAPTYNAMFAIRVNAKLSIDALRSAFQGILDRHTVLRSSFVLRGDDFVQRIHAAREADFGFSDASAWDENQLDARLVEDASSPYDLECDSVIRLNVYSRSPESHVLMLGVQIGRASCRERV